jgi:hypothetical protein
MTEAAALVLDLVEDTHDSFPYGLEPLPGDRHPLQERVGLSVCLDGRTVADIGVDASRVFRLPASVSLPRRQLLVGREVADLMLGGAAELLGRAMRRLVRDSYAVAGILNVRAWAAGGDQYLCDTLLPLAPGESHFCRRTLPAVLEVVREVYLHLVESGRVVLTDEELQRLRHSGGRLLTVLARTARNGDGALALVWLERAAMLCRQLGDTEGLALALVGAGTPVRCSGELREARGLLLDAVDLARQAGARHVEGMAHHDLLVIATEDDNHHEFCLRAAAAKDAYGPGNPALARLGNDVAWWWMKRGQHGDARHVFEALLTVPRICMDPEHYMLTTCALARAAAGSGDTAAYELAWRHGWEAATSEDAGLRAADALMDLGEAALLAGHWLRARGAGGRASVAAAERGDSRAEAAAASVIERATAGEGAVFHTTELEPVAWSPDAELAREIVEALLTL